jgi:hypothetical protein
MLNTSQALLPEREEEVIGWKGEAMEYTGKNQGLRANKKP